MKNQLAVGQPQSFSIFADLKKKVNQLPQGKVYFCSEFVKG